MKPDKLKGDTTLTPIVAPDIGDRVLLLGPGPEWQEGIVHSCVTSCNKTWVRVGNNSGYLFGFELENGQSWWREIEATAWIGGAPHGVKVRSLRRSFTLLPMTPENLAKRQRDLDIALCLDAYRKDVGSWAPDVLRRVAEVLRQAAREVDPNAPPSAVPEQDPYEQAGAAYGDDTTSLYGLGRP